MALYVIGVGPWDPDLITVKAIKALAKVQVVYYSSLINPEVIRRYAPRAKSIYMGHVRGDEHEGYVKEAIEYAKGGLEVAFLKNGDPTLFSRGVRICREAKAQGVECIIIPGVASFTAAAAEYELELGDLVTLVSYPNVSRGVVRRTTVLFMASAALDKINEYLKGNDEVVVVSRVTYPDGILIKVNRSEPLKLKPLTPSLIFIMSDGNGVNNT
ncbi:SAM-dependent methyltransferase [Caldivirga maquilingensis]|uniref:uroporphyrinogen-III C-methyltransferase n=1 Tax=Caldivirga maquilingensis (strain ATCC 700844 / DSM 13496 / JCM 10307 / IC-167) TaxID=397948 RepID=A8ME48_CALMQ|nr:SAM-dependent methyltransferase [Caldivirga maquilingensis]ABW02054.1 Uroporphyrin-III C/tetrapyrrole (Corrin/Porphyrin) methyltransferase [Caldivirga maquilingensis IC-167]